ncbi:MAG: hypothetical protein K2K87_13555, partial [Lachnospiraceae bacterium]|nr:hypothetical protein [Lachnospiraceae bacterium]
GKILEYGTPFALKEQYAKDRLHLIPSDGQEAELTQMLANMRLLSDGQENADEQANTDKHSDSIASNVVRADGRFILSVKDSMDALEILNAVKPCLCGFEMIQGTLDDVFLNVTGKSLEQQ